MAVCLITGFSVDFFYLFPVHYNGKRIILQFFLIYFCKYVLPVLFYIFCKYVFLCVCVYFWYFL